MPVLNNPKHEHFAQLIAGGASATKAYGLAGYPGDGAAQSANRLRKAAKVRERVAELQAAVAERAVEKAALDRTWVLDRLRENVARAMQATAPLDDDGRPCGDYRYEGQVANRALELLGKELGMFKDHQKLEVEGDLTLAERLIAARRRVAPVNIT
jgi:phage terminase small subunit